MTFLCSMSRRILCFYSDSLFLQACTQKMSELCNYSKIEPFKCGSLVAIKGKDTWHRAQVTQVQGSMFKVLMIDVGKEQCLQLYEVKRDRDSVY